VDSHPDVPTLSAHLAFTLRAPVDDLGGDPAAGETAGVDAVEVVVAKPVGEVALEPGEADVQVAGEGRPPALLEHRLGARPRRPRLLAGAGADEAVAPSQLLERLAEGLRPILAAVVGEDAFQSPAGGPQLLGDPAGEPGALLARGVATWAGDELGPGEVATCALGRVVDPSGAVLGCAGLSVADASVIPTIPPANTNLSTVAVAELLAERIAAS
jgi:choline dehydrogenase-like flavoprotein